ncbi:hypothetical protein F4809DRAFT_232676 [Biscogniauxia mediterranea]|nr:hypothetical protein F4809DRAFT_232676 [Biscogniauxia mediterranea]
MTEPASEQRSSSADPPHAELDTHIHPPPFAPIFTLVNDTSNRTTHHPHVVRYIFSDDDPDILTQALAEYTTGIDASAHDSASAHRAMILDLAPNSEGGYSVEWASSLSPSWAVLNAEVSQISSSSDGGNDTATGGDGESSNRPDRLMLRIEGVESGVLGSEGDLKVSGEASRHISGSASGSGSGSGQKDRERGEGEDYTSIFDEFEKRMTTLRKVVDASEDRRRKIGAEAGGETAETHGITVEETFAG